MQGFLPRGAAADLSPPSSAQVENEWSHTCTYICSSMACSGQINFCVISSYTSALHFNAKHNECSSFVESQCSH